MFTLPFRKTQFSGTETRVLLSFLINGFGSWMTFTALALMLNEKFGSSHVAYNFLLQSLPSLLFVAPIIKQLKNKWTYRIFYLSFLFSALVSIGLTKTNTIIFIYILTFLGSFLTGIRQPLFWSLATKWFKPQERQRVNTRLAAINGLTLCLAPPLGSWLSIKFGYTPLFIIDAATFLIAPLLLLSQKNQIPTQAQEPNKTEAKTLIEAEFKSSTKSLVYLWYSFLLVGAFFNALEFEGFNRASLDKKGIGLILGAWGIGSFIALLGANKGRVSKKILGIILIACYGTFFFQSSHAILFIIFFVGGWVYALFSGELRSDLQSEEQKNNFRSVDFWSLIQKRLAFINIVAYSGVGLLLQNNLWGFSLALFLMALVFFGIFVSRLSI